MNDATKHSNLRYVDSRHVKGMLVDRLDVWTTEGRRIGSFDGVVVDPDENRARFLVVDCGRYRPQRRLVPLPAQLDVIHQALRVDANDIDLDQLPPFDARWFPPIAHALSA